MINKMKSILGITVILLAKIAIARDKIQKYIIFYTHTFTYLMGTYLSANTLDLLNKDTLLVNDKPTQKIFLRIGGRNLLFGIPPFVIHANIMRQISSRISVGCYGYYTSVENPLLYYRISNGNFIDKNPQYNSYYHLTESPRFFLMKNKPYRHFAIGISTEYQIIPVFWKNKSLLIEGGLSFTKGVVASKMIYLLYNTGYVFGSKERYYSIVFYENIALDIRIRIVKNHFNRLTKWSISWYTSFIPTMLENKHIFLGWLLELNLNFKK